MAAISERDAAARQVKARRSALEMNLKTHRDYQAAEKETEAARRRLSDLSGDTTLPEDQQQKLASELSGSIRRPTEMRKEAELSDGELQEAMRHRQDAEKKIFARQPQLKRAIDSDPALAKAAADEKQAAAHLEIARNHTLRAEQDFNTAQVNVERQNQQLQESMGQNRRRRR